MGFNKTLILLVCAAVLLVAVHTANSKNFYRTTGKTFQQKNDAFNYTERFQVNTTANKIPFKGQYFTGYIKANTTTNSTLFYTLYSANGNNQSATNSTLNSSNPLILWLQGGPGCSSWLGNLGELGPMTPIFNATDNTSYLVPNPYSWNGNNHLLFVDQPFGVGFSFGANGDTQNNTVNSSIYLETFLMRFFQVYPELQNKPFYIAGESYAGHYIPGIVARLVQNKKVNNINVTGVLIGNGLIAPQYQLIWDAFGYAAGLLDQNQRTQIANLESAAWPFMMNNDWVNAFNGMNAPQGAFQNFNPDVSFYNFREYAGDSNAPDATATYLNMSSTYTALNMDPNVTWVSCSGTVGDAFQYDIPQDYSVNLTYVLNNDPSIKVLIYTGSDDIICNTYGQLNWIKNSNWANTPQFLQSNKTAWKLDNGTIAGTVKSFGSFTYAQIYKAGHMVPLDQPQSALKMLNNWFAGVWN